MTRNSLIVEGLLVFTALILTPSSAGAVTCPGDLDRDGAVGAADLAVLLGAWGPCPACSEDINQDDVVGPADLALLLGAWGRCEPFVSQDYFGHYTGTVTLGTEAFFPPGDYPAEVAIAQTESGIVGFINITVNPGDLLGGIVTHTFSARLGEDAEVECMYTDRICGGGDPVDQCYPHAAGGFTQYSFIGNASLDKDQLTLSQPSVLPDLPYDALPPFESASMTRTPRVPRDSFNGTYDNLAYIWMGTALFPLPLPLFGSNQVEIEDGQITDWVSGGFEIPIAGMDPAPIINNWCFDDRQSRGWMNQQGQWYYHWILDSQDQGVAVIVTFSDALLAPDCRAFDDLLAGDGLDRVHQDIAGLMIELR